MGSRRCRRCCPGCWAHETILVAARDAANRAAELGDEGTNDLFISEVVRINELQVWFLGEHLVDTPLVRA